MAANGGRAEAGGYVLEIDAGAPFQANILWRWMGPRAVPHLPCSFDCRASVEFANTADGPWPRARITARRWTWLEEILSWPVSWSALHGIAEVKTPVLKASTRTDATGARVHRAPSGSACQPKRRPDSVSVSHTRAAGPHPFAGVPEGPRGADRSHSAPPEWYASRQRLQHTSRDGRSASSDRGTRADLDRRRWDGARSRLRQRRAAEEDRGGARRRHSVRHRHG